jgi:hypothetical protein
VCRRRAISTGVRPRRPLSRARRAPARRLARRGRGGGRRGLATVELLIGRVADALRRRSLRFDDRPVSPHLTLARVRDEATLAEAKTVAAAVDAIRPPTLRFAVGSISVVQSVLSAKGPRYTEVISVPLRGDGQSPARRPEERLA